MISNKIISSILEKTFHVNPLNFRIYAGFEVDKEIGNSSIGNKSTNIYEQNPICNGSLIVSDLNDVLQSGYYESTLQYNNLFGL